MDQESFGRIAGGGIGKLYKCEHSKIGSAMCKANHKGIELRLSNVL